MPLTTPARTLSRSASLTTKSSTNFGAPQLLSTFCRVHRQLHVSIPLACARLSCRRVNHIKHWRVSGQHGSRHVFRCQASSADQSNTMPQPHVSDRRLMSDASAVRDSSMPSLGFWSRVRQHSWTPHLLKDWIYQMQTWTTEFGPNFWTFAHDALMLPRQPEMNYPTLSDLVWKSFAVLIAIVVLMVVVCTVDSGYLYFVVKLMRRSA